MCLAKVYTYKGNEAEKFLVDGVAQVEFQGPDILLTNIVGEQKRVRGTMKTMDLEDSIIRIELKD